jgi:aerobic carbon-monoxide dehydrogenase medium subunit
VKLPPFQLHRPTSREEAIALLADLGDDAVVLAGGQSLIPALALRLAHPSHLIDVNRAGSGEMRPINGRLGISFLVRQQDALASPELGRETPLLMEALACVGHPETRSRGTVAGSIAHADPSAELPAVALALDGELMLESVRGERAVPAESFFVAPFTTMREPDELLTEIRFSTEWSSAGWSFKEIARRHNDFAVAAVAVALRLGEGGEVADVRIVCAGVGGVPVRALSAENGLRGANPDRATIEEAAATAVQELDPPTDVLASAAYRKQAVRVLTVEALSCAADRAWGHR